MKIAWMATIAATMLAIAALLWDLFGRPAAPFLAATGPWPASLCDRPPLGARGIGRALPGYRLYFEGMSRLVGACHPADPAAGVATVERAFDRGLPGAYAISFVDALIAQGRRDDAARWLGQAAIVAIEWRALGFDDYGVPLPTSTELRAEIARLRGVLGRADAAALATEIEAILANGGRASLGRSIVDPLLVGRLFQVDPAAANYWRYRTARLNGEPAFMFGGLHPNLYFAQLCGNLPALAEAVSLFADGLGDPRDAARVIDSLLLARDNGADVVNLISLASGKLKQDLEFSDTPEFRADYAAWVEKTCPESFATQRRHFEVPPR